MVPDSSVAVLFEAYASILSNEGTSLEIGNSGMLNIRRDDDTVFRFWNLKYGWFPYSPKEAV